MGAAAIQLQDEPRHCKTAKAAASAGASSTALCSARGCTSLQPHQLHLQHPTAQQGDSQPYSPPVSPSAGGAQCSYGYRAWLPHPCTPPPISAALEAHVRCPGRRWMEPTCPKEWVQLCPQLAFGCCPLCKDEPTTLSTAQLVTVVVHQVGAGGHSHLPRLLGRCHGTKHLPPLPGHRSLTQQQPATFVASGVCFGAQ